MEFVASVDCLNNIQHKFSIVCQKVKIYGILFEKSNHVNELNN